METKHVKWMRVDNAGKIYPAAKRKTWTAMFRVSATLNETVDPIILDEAFKNTLKRFPCFAQRLRSGLFWYYLEHIDSFPSLQQDVSNPCVRMNWNETGGFMVRARYYDKTIAVEVFHVLSDGTGGLSFLLTLVAEYLRIKYNEVIPRDKTILDCTEEPSPDESEDAFARFARNEGLSRSELNSYHIRGTNEPADEIHVICGSIPSSVVRAKATALNVSVGEYLASVMIQAIIDIQNDSVKIEKFKKPVKVGVPVNLRRFYPTNTKRNFASYVNMSIEPRLGEHSFEEIVESVHHQMRFEVTEKRLNAKFSTNVHSEQSKWLRPMPLFIKNLAMRIAFYMVGDKKTATTLSNLGVVKLPEEMGRHVDRLDFLVGPLSKNKVVCGAVTYKDTLNINFVRTIMEPTLERHFFRLLVKQGVPVKILSNNCWE